MVVKPLTWLFRLMFDVFLVPLYRWYSFLDKKMGKAAPAADGVSRFFAGRLTIHVFVGLLGLALVGNNLIFRAKVASSEELVGQTKLSTLISRDIFDSEQLIEDYPDQETARLERQLQLGEHGLSSTESIFTNEEPTPEESQPALAARTEIIGYTVQTGDTISGIASRFNVSVNTILWENDLKATSLIKPGNQLNILPFSGISHSIARGQTLGQIAQLYDVDSEKILNANGLSDPNQLTAGAKLLIPGGSQLASATPVKRTTSQLASGLAQIIGQNKPAAIIPSGNRMVWPTVGHHITQYYSWRHSGLDIANKVGTPIYAAESGTITTAGWNSGGYGNQIIINHGNGKQTRYAHLSSFGVRVGQKVNKGQYIGAMGSTGRSTGPHLHFEVMINSARYNPLNYTR